jgi:hypothetical protein
MQQFDFVIIGGGFFGVYSALLLAGKGYNIALVEQDSQLMTRAAVINQARLHAGYHYPRSIGTAKLSDEYRQRFREEHQGFINSSFTHYYALDAYQSFTDTGSFERFCETLNIPCEKLENHPSIQMQRLKALYRVEEVSFDPDAIANFYIERVQENNRIKVFLKNTLRKVKATKLGWEIDLLNGEHIGAAAAINATYAGTNQVQSVFGQPLLDLVYELSEVCLCKPGTFKETGLTVMDGPFCSYIPFGNSGLHSLTSVLYTHHAVSKNNLPHFSCQNENKLCSPGSLQPCSTCQAQPASSFEKMKKQLALYVPENCLPHYHGSRFTVKTKLAASQIDDSRPTEIGLFQKNPAFYCIFAGKINAIYELEKVLNL